MTWKVHNNYSGYILLKSDIGFALTKDIIVIIIIMRIPTLEEKETTIHTSRITLV